MEQIRILIVATECAGLGAAGGVAEYVPALAREWLRQGHDVRVAMPHYGFLSSTSGTEVLGNFPVHVGPGAEWTGSVRQVPIAGPGADHPLHAYLIGGHPQFAQTTPRTIYAAAERERWIAFSRTAVDFLEQSDWIPDVIQCNDAHTAMVPVYLKIIRARAADSPLKRVRSVLTIHNLLDQLVFEQGQATVEYAGLDAASFHEQGFEFWGKANVFKAGMLAADAVSTVSRTYAREIRESEDFGFGLAGVLRDLSTRGRLTGIVNGIDEARWAIPGFDYLQHDTAPALSQLKLQARAKLFPEWGWSVDGDPVIIVRSRWDFGKGIRILVERAEAIAQQARLVVCAWNVEEHGEAGPLWQRLRDIAAKLPNRILVNPPGVTNQAETAAHYMIADMLLMPSIYEPCGLAQMEAFRFGVVTLATCTGGLADTVFDGENGFLFERNSAAGLMAAVDRAVTAFGRPELKCILQENALRQSNAWKLRVPEYEAMYRAALRR